MEIAFTTEAKADLAYWKKTNKTKTQERIAKLLHSMQQDPFKGIGKPEALKHNLLGQITDNRILVHSLKGH